MPTIVGREAELGAVHAFVDGLADGPAALVLEGDAGMGKTTLWNAALDHAEQHGVTVLRSRPAESETALSFAGVFDLLDPVLDRALDPLPAAQRKALSRALVLEDDEGPPPDPHAVGVAVLNALRGLAATEPVVVAVDDVQWLDSASAGALAFAARRLDSEEVGVLVALRSGLERGLAAELTRCVPGPRFTDLEVGPLDVSCLHRVVQSQLGVTLARPLLAEVHQAARGNPFYALEIVRTLKRTGVSVEAGHPLPVPDTLHDLVHGRLLALPEDCRRFLLAAAACSNPTVAIAESASGVSRSVGLPPATEAGVVEVDGDRVRFEHPLLAAGAYETATVDERKAVHARLAELLDSPEARAWQLAASVDEPDEVVAATLEEAARSARSRGAPRPAALLLDRARGLTPADRPDDAVRRAVEAAFLHFEAGDSRRAETDLRELIAPLAPGPQRASALLVLARIRLYEAPAEAKELFGQVVEEAGDIRTRAVAHEGMAACSVWMFESFEECLAHTRTAVDLAAELDDAALAGDMMMVSVTAETLLGRPEAAASREQALALQASARDLRVLDQPLISVAESWIWVDEHVRAREALTSLLERAQELGDENARPWTLCLLAEVELLEGNLASALDHALEAREAADQSGQPLFGGIALALEALSLAYLGRAVEAADVAQRAAEVNPDRFTPLGAAAALGHLALVQGAPEETVARLEPQISFVRDEGIVEPGFARFATDLIEAHVELGQTDQAAELLDWYETNARRLERVSALASCARCRGLLAAQAGDLEAAVAAYAAALELHAQVEFPLDRARTLLAFGATQRRAKRRRAARATLEEAEAVFERSGAALWAERARAELKRISGRAPAPGALTPAEQKVAALVAEGKTNREVAAALFLSDRTVEGHLSHVFAKLGIRHRTELARALEARQSQGVTAPNTGESPVSGATRSS
jgi:DNA-binding CsgD family transcriptional regulator